MRTPNSFLTADAVLLVGREVLLIQRGREPFMGKWALPGGFVDPDEKVLDAAQRELQEETGISEVTLEEFGAYGDPGRDPRGRTISVVFWSRLDSKPHAIAGDDAGACAWFSLDQIPEMAFDHGKVLADVRSRIDSSAETHGKFLNFVDLWFSQLETIAFDSLFNRYQRQQTAVLCVDLLNGFTREGNLSSPRVAGIIPPIVQLFNTAERMEINQYVLLKDSHPPHSKEFQVYPPHCIVNSKESQIVKELRELSYASKFKVLPKETINPGVESNLQDWLKENTNVRQFIVTGDCTDICVYLLCLYLKTWSVKNDLSDSIVVPANCVDTFDLTTNMKETKGALPHPGEFMHRFFLYHMQLNGIRVVAGIE